MVRPRKTWKASPFARPNSNRGSRGFTTSIIKRATLSAAFLHPRTFKFINLYKYNILKDFADAKTPKFMMVSGSTPMIYPQGNIRPSVGIVYVVEATSGIVCAYAAPYATNRESIPTPTNETLRLVDKGKFRSQAIRDKLSGKFRSEGKPQMDTETHR